MKRKELFCFCSVLFFYHGRQPLKMSAYTECLNKSGACGNESF